MSLKSLITETVLIDSMYDIESELLNIKEALLEQMIIEGVDDPGILKCVFMAGGPGSGKSFTAMEIFGIDKRLKASFSSTGLKSVNSDSAFEKGLRDNGIDPRKLADIEKNDAELWYKISGGSSSSSDSSYDVRKGKRGGAIKGTSIRAKAKALTAKQKKFYEAGRLGMIIDGTGDEVSKIKRKMEHAESLGYDCYMVFVNTSLEVAQERNKNRDRVLPEELLNKSWNDVQSNLGKFQGLFSGNITIVDNTVYKPIDKQVQKAIDAFIRKPIYNRIGKKWIQTARALKNANLIKK